MTLQLFPNLDPVVEEALRHSIRRFGVLAPVCVSGGPWEPGALLDGHHRRRIAAEENLPCSEMSVAVLNEDEAVAIATTLNQDRRHLDPDQRRQIVADLRSNGHSLRAIAGAVGVDPATVHRDLAGVAPATPAEIHGRDGKTYPATKAPADEPEADPADISAEEAHAILDELEGTYGDDLTEEIIDQAVEDNLESKRTPMPLNKTDLGGGVSHPARFTDGLIPLFAEFLEEGWEVLDPFAGTGKIHELRNYVNVGTAGVEIEQEWAELCEWTIQGDALDLPYNDEIFDAIVTSPTYGNRLADAYEGVSDPEARRSYRFDLGRPLSENNSGKLQWGPKYRDFHRGAWEEALRVLRPGGLFVLNIKDHIRDGKRQHVSAWHATTLLELGCALVDCVPFGVVGLRNGANHLARLDGELVWVFSKETGR